MKQKFLKKINDGNMFSDILEHVCIATEDFRQQCIWHGNATLALWFEGKTRNFGGFASQS